MIPSLLFFVPIFPIKLLIPGTWLATPTILRLMLASVSLCNPKFSLTAYACASTLSTMLWLLSTRRRSSSMYSASASPGFCDRYASMSLRTFERRLARSRAVEMLFRNRVSSVRCCVSISRCRARLVDFRAEVVASESRRRWSCARRADR